jgi:hypothetical protein
MNFITASHTSYKQLINRLLISVSCSDVEVLKDGVYLYHGINIQYYGPEIFLPFACPYHAQTV